MHTDAVAFLFNADTPGLPCWFGGYFDAAFLEALSTVDPSGCTLSSILRGDVLIANLAMKIDTVFKEKHGSGGYRRSCDKDLLSTVIWDLADALAGQWNTLNTRGFRKLLGRNRIHCISVPTLPDRFREKISTSLCEVKGYLGAIKMDLGNPLQKRLFIDFLVKDAVIANGEVILELGWEGDLNTMFNGAENFYPRGWRLVPYGTLDELHPPIQFPSSLSSRGKLSQERYEGKSTYSLQERVITALVHGPYLEDDDNSYNFASINNADEPLQADLPEQKFTDYLLNSYHHRGCEKAKLLKAALGIEKKDWRYLAAQLHDGLNQARLQQLRIKTWKEGLGITFNAIIPVLGLNGRTIEIKSNWIMEPGMRPKLVTLVPVHPTDVTAPYGSEHSVISSEITGNERWQTIFNLASEAGHAAEKIVIPTPLDIPGFGIIPEGECGNAFIRVMDARRGFAKWVIANNYAQRHHKSGALIFSDVSSQSIERARAYALAFAKVLKQNGVDCEVESYFT